MLSLHVPQGMQSWFVVLKVLQFILALLDMLQASYLPKLLISKAKNKTKNPKGS